MQAVFKKRDFRFQPRSGSDLRKEYNYNSVVVVGAVERWKPILCRPLFSETAQKSVASSVQKFFGIVCA
jgi:hypothetical protein